MEWYQEITIRSTTELSAAHIWSKIYQQLHMRFIEFNHVDGQWKFGVSFPGYQDSQEKKTLGNSMRVFAPTDSDLEDLNLTKLLRLYDDYVDITDIRDLRGTHIRRYASYWRYRFESSRENKARRYAKRHGVSVDEAMELFPERILGEQPPYIQMRSLSTGQRFRLYIKKTPKEEEADEGFGAYGLSEKSALPEF